MFSVKKPMHGCKSVSTLYCPVQIEDGDPLSGSISELRKVFNDCLRLLSGKVISDEVSIKSMLEDLGWLSLNQLAAETRLIEAWKTVHLDDCSGIWEAKRNNKDSFSLPLIGAV